MSETKKKLEEPSRCPKCGNTFHCSTSSKCWCYEIDVPAEVMEKLQQEYIGCLCPECLKTYAR
ncbi:MAG: cysteine-rich CWC family protein [Bacteroidales bacterium]|nr:cysteine-rich CWC family protein [Bacteroidales bacterium]